MSVAVSDVAAIREQIRVQLDTIPGLTVYRVMPGGEIVTPAAIVRFASREFHRNFDGASDLRFEVLILAGSTQNGPGPALDALDYYLSETGSKAIIDVIENNDPTLGGTVDSVKVLSVRGHDAVGIGTSEFTGATFDIEVYV